MTPGDSWPEPEILSTDIAVVGSGGAGLMCVLHALTADPGLKVTVVSKGAVGRSGCTRMVQGGYNAVLDPNDSTELHFRDTLQGGKFLNDQSLAWALVQDAPRVINELETRVGCFFDRSPDGRIHQKAFAGQAFDRTVHRGDLTGIEIMGRLRDQMFRLGPTELEDVRALDLVHDRAGRLAGLTCVDMRTGRPLVLRARVVVIATGGSATMYRVAAPAREKTGDGMAMCWRAGLAMRDMEMLQFHPTGLLAGNARMTGAVLEEGLRGAGATLRNAEGERYMRRYDPERMERSTRDLVARAGYTEIMEGRGTPDGGVLIDISHLGAAEVQRLFPGMLARTRQIGQDLANAPVRVSPTAHFHMGGVLIDPDCRTSLDGLLVAGEDAGGTHGANRLGGNGVAESTVFGARAGDTAAAAAATRAWHEPDSAEVHESLRRAYAPLTRETGPWPFELTTRLKELMWQRVGVVRDAEGLAEASKELAALAEDVERIAVPGPAQVNFAWQEAMDLANQVTVARAIADAAAWRTETRGAHARSDYPDSGTRLRYLVQRRGGDGLAAPIDSEEHDVRFSHLVPPEHSDAEPPGPGQPDPGQPDTGRPDVAHGSRS